MTYVSSRTAHDCDASARCAGTPEPLAPCLPALFLMQQRTLMLPRALRPGRRVAAERWLPACAILALLALSGPAAASNLLVQTLPGWVSHASQGLAIAQECLRRGHNVTALFSTDDAQRLAARGLLPPALRVVAYRAPPDSLTQHAQLVEMMDDPRRISEV